MTGMPKKHHMSFVTNDELASENELNTFYTRFEISGSSEKCREVLESGTLGPRDRVEITVDEVARVFRQLIAQKSVWA